jgi:hypothetical protein
MISSLVSFIFCAPGGFFGWGVLKKSEFTYLLVGKKICWDEQLILDVAWGEKTGRGEWRIGMNTHEGWGGGSKHKENIKKMCF